VQCAVAVQDAISKGITDRRAAEQMQSASGCTSATSSFRAKTCSGMRSISRPA
jgi:hypothetical protein